MKIVHVIDTLGHGGAEHQLALLAPALQARGHENVVVHLHGPDYVAARLREGGVKVINLDRPLSKKEWPRLVLGLVQVLRAQRPDVIHTSLFEADILAGAAAGVVGVPAVATLCNIGGEEVRLADNPLNSRLKLRLSTELWAWALLERHQHCVAISQAVKDSALRTYRLREERVSVVYRALTPADQAPRLGEAERTEVLRELGALDRGPVLLHVGRQAPQKGQIYLIESMRAVADRHPKVVLWMVGEGWLRPDLEAKVKELGLEEQVKFLGKRTDVPRLMRTADVFVFPSLFEGLGVSLLQAAAAGMACVTTDVGPLPEVIDQRVTGLLVPPRDSPALSAALLDLAADPTLGHRLGAAARAQALERFTLEKMVEGTLAAYQRALGEPGPSG